MRKVTFYLSLSGIVFVSFFTSEHRSYAQDFYAGKTIRILVGFPAGGGFDTYSRTIAAISANMFPAIRRS
jgi:tripartite-type tricarboxylate transporter receptor subunit TctC